MEFNLLFLLTSIVTARFLDKRKMRAASIMYSTMFIIMLFVLLFTVDIDLVRQMMMNAFGSEVYQLVHNAFVDAISTPAYGVYIIGSVILTVAVQVSVTVLAPVSAIVRYLIKKKNILHKFKKAYVRLVHQARSLYIVTPINRLYCRMLN